MQALNCTAVKKVGLNSMLIILNMQEEKGGTI